MSLYIEALNNICKKMKENSSIWDLLAKRTDHSLSKEEAEALEQMLKEDTSLQRASQLVASGRSNEPYLEQGRIRYESKQKATIEVDYPSLCRGSQYCCPMCVGWCIGLSALG